MSSYVCVEAAATLSGRLCDELRCANATGG
jgi:hypothetical protein